MLECTGDLWKYHSEGKWIVVPTNGVVNKTGRNVMGRGVALQAAQRFPYLPGTLGTAIKLKGNNVFNFTEMRIITFPVKHKWWKEADINLIERSADQLRILSDGMMISENDQQIYLPRVGAGNGRLKWDVVKSILEKYLDDRFTVVTYE